MFMNIMVYNVSNSYRNNYELRKHKIILVRSGPLFINQTF